MTLFKINARKIGAKIRNSCSKLHQKWKLLLTVGIHAGEPNPNLVGIKLDSQFKEKYLIFFIYLFFIYSLPNVSLDNELTGHKYSI